jgi:hypothetical protein
MEPFIRFDGEDLGAGERKKQQSVQQRAWLIQQMTEQKQREKEMKLANELLLASVKARDWRADQISQLESECKRQLNRSTTSFNLALVSIFY